MKMFQIHENDLADLEQSLPALCDGLAEHLTAANRTTFRRLQRILANVRWNYGPHESVERIDDVPE